MEARKNGIWTQHDTDHNTSSNWSHQSNNIGSQGVRDPSQWVGLQRKDKRLKEHFINGVSDEKMMTEIMRELSGTKETNKASNEQVLCWAKRLEVKTVQKVLFEASKETKEFDAVKKVVKQSLNKQNIKRNQGISWHTCKYCGTLHKPRRCPAYGKNCTRCGRANHFEILKGFAEAWAEE